jgi:hypothetical protein
MAPRTLLQWGKESSDGNGLSSVLGKASAIEG